MKILFLGFICFYTSYSFAQGLSQTLNLPDGLSMGWDGAIIANENYSITQTKLGKMVKFKKEDRLAINSTASGEVYSIVYRDTEKKKISYVNMQAGAESVTRCDTGRSLVAKLVLDKCITVNKKTCASLLKISGSKDFTEFVDKVNACSSLSDPAMKSEFVGIMSTEKKNAEAAMNSMNLVWSEYGDSITREFLQQGGGASAGSTDRYFRYLGSAVHLCKAELLTKANFHGLKTTTFERKGTQ